MEERWAAQSQSTWHEWRRELDEYLQSERKRLGGATEHFLANTDEEALLLPPTNGVIQHTKENLLRRYQKFECPESLDFHHTIYSAKTLLPCLLGPKPPPDQAVAQARPKRAIAELRPQQKRRPPWATIFDDEEPLHEGPWTAEEQRNRRPVPPHTAESWELLDRKLAAPKNVDNIISKKLTDQRNPNHWNEHFGSTRGGINDHQPGFHPPLSNGLINRPPVPNPPVIRWSDGRPLLIIDHPELVHLAVEIENRRQALSSRVAQEITAEGRQRTLERHESTIARIYDELSRRHAIKLVPPLAEALQVTPTTSLALWPTFRELFLESERRLPALKAWDIRVNSSDHDILWPTAGDFLSPLPQQNVSQPVPASAGQPSLSQPAFMMGKMGLGPLQGLDPRPHMAYGSAEAQFGQNFVGPQAAADGFGDPSSAVTTAAIMAMAASAMRVPSPAHLSEDNETMSNQRFDKPSHPELGIRRDNPRPDGLQSMQLDLSSQPGPERVMEVARHMEALHKPMAAMEHRADKRAEPPVVPAMPLRMEQVQERPAPVPKPPPQSRCNLEWEYLDPQNEIQGPFSSQKMYTWWARDFFPANLPLRRAGCSAPFTPLDQVYPEELREVTVPFLDPPPIRASDIEMGRTNVWQPPTPSLADDPALGPTFADSQDFAKVTSAAKASRRKANPMTPSGPSAAVRKPTVVQLGDLLTSAKASPPSNAWKAVPKAATSSVWQRPAMPQGPPVQVQQPLPSPPAAAPQAPPGTPPPRPPARTADTEQEREIEALCVHHGISLDADFIGLLASCETRAEVVALLKDNLDQESGVIENFVEEFWDLVKNPFKPVKKGMPVAVTAKDKPKRKGRRY